MLNMIYSVGFRYREKLF